MKRVENSAAIVAAAEEDRSGLESEFPLFLEAEVAEKKVFSWLNTSGKLQM